MQIRSLSPITPSRCVGGGVINAASTRRRRGIDLDRAAHATVGSAQAPRAARHALSGASPRRLAVAVLALLGGIVGSATLYAQSGDDWYVGKPIADIRFAGLRHVAEADLREIVQPYVERVFTLDLFWELQGRLYATDLFESLESNAIAVDDQQSAVIVEFRVQERPLVGSVELAGNQRVRDTELLEVMELSPGDVFDPIKLDADEAALRGLYVAKGYPDASIAIDTVRDDEAGEVAVTVQVAEGFEVTVDEIRFVGNEFASESTLRGRMRTKKRSLFESGAFRATTLQEDQDIIESFYAAHGYVDASVDRIERELRLDPEQQRRSLTLTIYLIEGQQYTYGGMLFEGNEIFSGEELNNRIRHRPDREVNREIVDADFLRVQDLYYESGYIFNLFELIEERDEDTRHIAYRVIIQERERAHIENIVVSGADKTGDNVILRELPFEVGDVFNRTAIVQGLRNLYNTQYFSAVTPDTPPGSAEGLMDVVITVEEQSTADINFGVTIGGSEFPFAGTVRWNERNLGGGGQSIGAGLELSPIKQSLNFEFVEPWLFGARWSGGVNLGLERSVVRSVQQDVLPPIFDDPDVAAPDPYESREEWQRARDEGESVAGRYTMEYTEWDIIVGTTTGYRIPTALGIVRFSGGLSSTLRFLTYDTAIYRPFEQTIRDDRENWVMVNRLDAGVAWDGRDIFLNPTEGWLLSQGASLTGGFLFGDRHFIRLNSRADGFVTLLKAPVLADWDLQIVLAAHSGFAVILPQFWVPQGERALATDGHTDLLALDGIRVARGWDIVRGGRARWENSAEIRVPVDPRLLWAVLFADAAVLWPELEDIESTGVEDFHFSLGAGLRFAIPQFPIRLYFANTFKIVDEPDQPDETLDLFSLDEWKFVISLGGDVF